MKKFLLVTAMSTALILGGCSGGGIDVNAIINASKAACAFTPAAAGVISLVNAQNQSGKTAIEIAQLICAAVNNVNPVTPGGGTKFAHGTEISVVVDSPTGPITIAGTVGK